MCPDPSSEPAPEAGEQAPQPARRQPLDDEHWSRARSGMNREALEHYRQRSRAPGVAEGGEARNHYCMSCDGVIPLEYDQRVPDSGAALECPHCGAPLEGRVRAMFNWVETDQVPGSTLASLRAPLLLLLALLLALLVWWLR